MPEGYWDRMRSPAETVAKTRPHWGRLGITRVADQTGLDRIGIPCFAAFRPNSHTLANNQGKGLTPDAARASAVMEAVEFAVAEAPQATLLTATPSELERKGTCFISVERYLPEAEAVDPEKSCRWVVGQNLFDGYPVAVPFDLIRLSCDPPEFPGIARSTNGLASGNTRLEAVFHGICELIERDAHTLWSLRGAAARLRQVLDPAALGDPVVSQLAGRVTGAGLTLRLFDQTTSIGVPTIMAAIGDLGDPNRSYVSLGAGFGTHPVTARAAIRAITEAAQTRVTSIAGSRDDILPSDYARPLPERALALLTADMTDCAPWPTGLGPGSGLSECHDFVLQRLKGAGVDQIAAIEISPLELGVSVVRLISPQLEDREVNVYWRPGARAKGRPVDLIP